MLCSFSSIDCVIVLKPTVVPSGMVALVARSLVISSVSSGRGSSERGV